MSFTREPEQFDETGAIVFPPSDLWSDEPPLESDLHLRQIALLIECLELYWRGCFAVPPRGNRSDFYATGNLTIYFSPEQIKSRDFRGPDFFVVLGADRRPRKSWVVWAEGGRYPNLIVEVLSDSTAAVDRGFKKQLYQDVFRTPDYFWFDPETLEFQGFCLLNGQYEAIAPSPEGWLWSEQLGLYLGIYERQLRYFTPLKQMLPSPQESANSAQSQLASTQEELTQAQAELAIERDRRERLTAKLRELGIDPDQIL